MIIQTLICPSKDQKTIFYQVLTKTFRFAYMLYVILMIKKNLKVIYVKQEATSKLTADKPVARRDAEGVIGAELRNDPNLATHPGSIATSLNATIWYVLTRKGHYPNVH